MSAKDRNIQEEFHNTLSLEIQIDFEFACTRQMTSNPGCIYDKNEVSATWTCKM